MKIFKFMVVALVAMLGLTACEKDCDHDFIEVDYSKDLVGTWTHHADGSAEALIIKADGSVESLGVVNGTYWEKNGTVKVKNNRITFNYGDGAELSLRFDLIPGKTLSWVNEEFDLRITYDYCENDLADEVVGMWVCTGSEASDMAIVTYDAECKSTFTAYHPEMDDYMLKSETTYKVIGDLMIGMELGAEGVNQYIITRLNYAPNGTSLGDILTQKMYLPTENGLIENVSSWLRIKQSLDLAGQNYNYIKTYVSNVKGEDKDIDFMGYTFNFSKMNGSELDKLLKAILFNVEFPDANTLNYSYNYNNVKATLDAPIVVEGNKMTIKMSKEVSTLKDVVLYAFQDADCSQLHFYMHRDAFVNFHTNMQTKLMESMDEQFDINNAEAVNAIYNEINNAVETINVSLVMSK